MRTRISSYPSGFHIAGDRFDAIMAVIGTSYTRDEIADVLFYDWPNAEEHQAWLDSGPVKGIADWAWIGARDARDVAEPSV